MLSHLSSATYSASRIGSKGRTKIGYCLFSQKHISMPCSRTQAKAMPRASRLTMTSSTSNWSLSNKSWRNSFRLFLSFPGHTPRQVLIGVGGTNTPFCRSTGLARLCRARRHAISGCEALKGSSIREEIRRIGCHCHGRWEV